MSKKLTTAEFIKKAKKVHGNKYDYSKVNYINSLTRVKIKCNEHGVFEQIPKNHLNGNGCNKCGRNLRLTQIEFERRAKEIHGDKYIYTDVNCVNSKTKIIIVCKEHGRFEQTINSHLKGSGCSRCSGTKKLTITEFIERAKEIHEDKYDYTNVNYVNANTNVSIICKIHGSFSQTPNAHTRGAGCAKCYNGRGINILSYDKASKYIKSLNLKTVKDWQNYAKSKLRPENIPSTPSRVYKNKGWKGYGDWLGTKRIATKAKKFITFKEAKNYVSLLNLKNQTEWYNYIKSGLKPTNIPSLPYRIYEKEWISWADFLNYFGPNNLWTKPNKLNLINTLEHSDLLTMDPFEIYTIIGQGKLPADFGSLAITDAGSDERITTLQELKNRLINEETTEVEDTLVTETIFSEETELVPTDNVDTEITTEQIETPRALPTIQITSDLHSLDNNIYATMDEEAFESLVQYKLRKLWNNILNGDITVNKIKSEKGGKYFTMIKKSFLDEYKLVSTYAPPTGFKFKFEPNLMQKLTVHRLLKNKSYGNWSGTGAGKTLSFIIGSREIDSRLTVVIALNSTIKQTSKVIKQVYKDSLIFTEYKRGQIFDTKRHNYLVLNYEKFQQSNSEELFQDLTNNNKIDFVVIDEVHNAKQREEDDESIRRGVLNRLLGRIREKNENLYTLAMSATPVVNNLHEAKSLLTLLTGLEYDDLETRRTLPNALKIFQQLILNGLRYIPKYDMDITELTGSSMSNLNIDGQHLLDKLINLQSSDYIACEKLLLDDKLEAIIPYLRKGVIVYSYFTTGFINKIQKKLTGLGFKVGTYTGDESIRLREGNLLKFQNGELDILIGSKPIGTGVDGLQDVCNRMILITLPWTDSEYTQLKGRIYRQGSKFADVEIIIPQIRITTGEDEIWSWDLQRLNLIKNKKTLADVAVDGVIPSRVLPSKDTLFKKSQESLLKWKDRINSGNIISQIRESIKIELYPEIMNECERAKKILAELQEFNRRGKITKSSTMHKEFTGNPDSWFRYHKLRRESMNSWDEVPYEYIATKIKNRNHIVVDFGCGENLMRTKIPQNKVISFDHVAIDDSVIACDMKDISQYVKDESVDVAVFSLALWGTNYTDYIKEAYRVLNYGGVIHIAEPAKDYENISAEKKLINLITNVGFKVIGDVEKRGKFIYITGFKD